MHCTSRTAYKTSNPHLITPPSTPDPARPPLLAILWRKGRLYPLYPLLLHLCLHTLPIPFSTVSLPNPSLFCTLYTPPSSPCRSIARCLSQHTMQVKTCSRTSMLQRSMWWIQVAQVLDVLHQRTPFYIYLINIPSRYPGIALLH
jgi:hypothetical protein